MTNTAHERVQALVEKGETLREDNPVVWAIVRGRSHTAKIGILLGKTPSQLRTMIDREIDARLIMRNPKLPHVLHVHPKSPMKELCAELKSFYEKIELKWLDEYPEMIKTALVSSPAIQVWKTAHPDKVPGTRVARYNEELTEKQAAFLVSLEPWADGKTFYPLQVARAQGYTQAGWTKRTLDTLAGKGFVLMVRASPAAYRLSPRGKEVRDEAIRKGVKAQKRVGTDIDISDL